MKTHFELEARALSGGEIICTKVTFYFKALSMINLEKKLSRYRVLKRC